MRIAFPIILLFACASPSIAQQRLEFTINGAAGMPVYLANYYGYLLYNTDTTIADANGSVVFDREGGYEPGLYAVMLASKRFEVVVNEPLVRMTTDASDLAGHVKVIESRENEIHHVLRKAAEAAPAEQRDAELMAVAEKDPGAFAAKLIRMGIEPATQEVRRADGSLDSAATADLRREHFWDNTDLQDARIVHAPIFQSRFEELMAIRLPKDPRPAGDYLERIIERSHPAVQKLIVNLAANRYAPASTQGMGAVYVRLAQRYACTGAHGTRGKDWTPADKWDTWCANAAIKSSLVVGNHSRDLVLCDTTEQHWVSLHAMPQECLVVVFWSPHCSHCKQALPAFHEKYVSELLPLNVGVYAVAEARDSTLFADWKKFIRTNKLDWVNVGLPFHVYQQWTRDPSTIVPVKTDTESMRFSETWEVTGTPQYYVLDKERRILAKPATITELLNVVKAYRRGAH